MNAAQTGMSVTQILRIVVLLLILVFAGWLIYTIRGTLLPFGVAFVLSYVLMPLVDRMEARGINRMVGVLIIYASTLVVFVLIFMTLVPVFVRGLVDMKNRIVGQRVTWTCVVQNRGYDTVRFDRFDSTDPSYRVWAPSLPLEIAPQESDTLRIHYEPASRAPSESYVIFQSEQAQEMMFLRVTGNLYARSPQASLGPACVLTSGTVAIALSDTAHHFGAVESGYLNRLQAQIAEFQPKLVAMLPMLEGIDIAEYINERVQGFATDLLRETPELAGSVISGITFVVIVPFVVFFFLAEGRTIKRAFVELVPNRYFEMVLNLLYRIDMQLGGYIRGLVMSVVIISLLSITGLRIIGLKDYLVVGIVAGLSNVIPYLGPLIGIVAGIVAALLQYSTLTMGVIAPVVAVFLVVQILDNIFVAPVVVARSVNLHPLVVVFVVLVGNQLFGAVGMLLAVPFTAVTKVSVQTIYEGLRSYSIGHRA
ncbi:MAG: AI-2E family transporter [Candidatus Latescibacteria bacterium]|nr:AI-2E family transporter [Candidatus Latescibacterota bacterium]